jgi:NADH-quinone oxidoreductase subunit C
MLLPEIGSAKLGIDDLAARLASELGDDLGGLRVQEPDTIVARVDKAALHGVAERLHGLPEIGYEQCNFIAAVDHVTHFETVYHLYSFASNSWLELHVDLPRAKPSVATVCDVWPSADWHEREAYDMMGIRFEGHPDLRRILLKDDWIGHPLRKDYVDLIENHPHV